MAPPPKPPGARVRRNLSQSTWKQLPAAGREGPAPRLPARKPGWLKSTRDWWRSIWASPMATVWLDSDYWSLVRLAQLVEMTNRGEATAAILAEISKLEEKFGLSPKARRTLQWEISRALEAVPDLEDATVAAGDAAPKGVRARLRAVDPLAS